MFSQLAEDHSHSAVSTLQTSNWDNHNTIIHRMVTIMRWLPYSAKELLLKYYNHFFKRQTSSRVGAAAVCHGQTSFWMSCNRPQSPNGILTSLFLFLFIGHSSPLKIQLFTSALQLYLTVKFHAERTGELLTQMGIFCPSPPLFVYLLSGTVYLNQSLILRLFAKQIPDLLLVNVCC